MMSSGSVISFGVPSETEDKNGKISISELDTYAIESWEKLLHYLVGSSSTGRPESVTKLLDKSGLMNGNRITSEGFQFLLQNMYIQIWSLLIEYVEMAEKLQMQPIEMIKFLFQLGSSELGQDYSVEMLSITQKIMLRDLAYLGLVFQRNKKSSRYYPTRLATSLTSGNSIDTFFQSDSSFKSSIDNGDSGFVILETNYRIYAYTSSTLQIATLALFATLQTRFANMVVGSISRDSIREALSRGITADQIISYLQSHAHPEMRISVNLSKKYSFKLI